MEKSVKRLLLVDFFALFHRARNALVKGGKSFSTSDGIPVSGVFPFINNLLATIKDQEPTHVVICFDAGGNQRKSENSDYKAQRAKVEPDFIREAKILLDEGIAAMGLQARGVYGYEADDVIHTVVHAGKYGVERMDEIIIWTCDQDLLQMVNGRVKVLLFNTAKKQKMMGLEEVKEKWDCRPTDIAYIKAISGDSSDNIKGVPRIGQKTATKIMKEAEWNFEEALKHPKLVNHVDLIRGNLELVLLRLVPELASEINFSDFEIKGGNAQAYVEFLGKYEFTLLLKRTNAANKLLKLQ